MRLTYLIGAGASVGAIPVVEGLNASIESFHSELKNDINPDEIKISPEKIFLKIKPKGQFLQLLNDIQWLIDESKKYSTIDTLAKKLYLKNEIDDYIKLKSVMTLYFNYRQSIKPLDLRYDNFFATILRK